MSLYERDFLNITEEENKQWETLKEKEIIKGPTGLGGMVRKSLYHEYPKAVRHYLSHFPNHFLDAIELKTEKQDLEDKLCEFKKLIDDNSTTEREILNFIKDEQAQFIIGSILKHRFSFGHHACFVFPELRLSTNYQVDFLIVGQNSDGYHFVFVELESANGAVTMKDGSFGETIRKGIKQVDDWEIWLEGNFAHLRPYFEKYLKKGKNLPREFTVFDKTRVHHVVAGKRKDFSEKTYRLRRNHVEQRKLHIIHYDNLIDNAKSAIGTQSY